jgi:hypothetical protein
MGWAVLTVLFTGFGSNPHKSIIKTRAESFFEIVLL